MNVKKIIVFFMVFCVALVQSDITYAMSNDVNSGSVTLAIVFTKEEAEDYKKSFENTFNLVINSYKEDIVETDSLKKKEYLVDLVTQLENYNCDDLFEEYDGNNVAISLPIRNAKIVIDDVEIQTDENGEYFTREEVLSNDDEKITIFSDDGYLLADDTQNIDVENDDIIYKKTFDDLGNGIKEMATGMEKTSAEAVVAQVFLPTLGKGKVVGKGVGKTKVVTDSNIVVCNKHDSAVENITATDFALQNSDCSRSVKLGLLFLSDPEEFARYWRGAYCVQEAVGNIDGEGNIYCKGKKHKVHYNCSWFPGINHSEKFHIHRYK